MAAVSDAFGGIQYGFMLATGLPRCCSSGYWSITCLPGQSSLQQLDRSEYRHA
jgi:hypothetical protein